MRNAFLYILGLISLSGCVTSPIPSNYSGPIATVRDSAISETSNRAQFYFLSEIDGQRIDNVLIATRKANSGRGFSLSTEIFARDIPAKPSKFKLEARISYGAPIQELINSSTTYTAESEINFTPESNKSYVVKGTLTADKREVWLEDASTGQRVK